VAIARGITDQVNCGITGAITKRGKMGFERGAWRCAVNRCGGKAEYSLKVHVRTAGGRKDRIQTSSPAVRLCPGCLTDTNKGKVPDELLAAIKLAIKQVKGER